MKKLLLSQIIIAASLFLSAQAPNQFKYQAVLRNADGTLMSEENVTVVVSILKSDLTTSVFEETHSITTTSQGLINLNIGSVEDLSTINWNIDEYFIEISVNGAVFGTSQLLSVPYALQAKTAESVTGPISETDPSFSAWDKSTGISITESQISDLNHFTSTDETDPLFDASIASGITSIDTALWNNKLDSYSETDPLFDASIASGITSLDIASWNDKLDSFSETDPLFNASVASGITSIDTALWNDKLDSYSETDPLFDASIASGITSTDIAYWNGKLDSYSETDPVFDASIASGITSLDTTYWNNKLDSYNETDPLFNASVASGITTVDIASWNDKSEFDGDFSTLYNAPNIANKTLEKSIQLNTNDATSSIDIKRNNGESAFKVDGTGRITGDGSGLSNVKPLINYTGGDQRYQITANYGSYNNVRSVSLTAPSDGVCFVMASGYVDWESINWDVVLFGILCDMDPNTSWDAEDEWYDYLNILTDYNCPDSSDQYTSFSQHRCIPVSAGPHTFYLWANKHTASAKVEVADVNLSVMFFPTGGTGKGTKGDMLKEEEELIIKKERIPNTVAGYK